MNLLELKHLKKSFDELEVIKDFSLSVKEGEVVSIIGPSGSGKSTILRCLTMLEQMDDGELSYLGEYAAKSENGRCVYASKEKLKQIHHYFGLVFQNFNLFPHYSVLKNIMDAPVSVDKVPKEEAKKRARKLMEQLGLSEKENAYPYQLSGGQQQRVAIARAMALTPDILCFDEPTSALDPELTGEVLRVIRNLKQKNYTMIIVTHDMAFAKSISDVVIYMADGVIEETGTPAQVFDAPKSERARNFLKGMQEEP